MSAHDPHGIDGVSYASNDWLHKGWDLFSPRQSLGINLLMSTIHVMELDGGLDELYDRARMEESGLIFGGLDGPLLWSWPDDPGITKTQRTRDAWQAKAFAVAYEAAGLAAPATSREFIESLAELGVFVRSTVGGVERWRMAEPLPSPKDVLPVAIRLV